MPAIAALIHNEDLSLQREWEREYLPRHLAESVEPCFDHWQGCVLPMFAAFTPCSLLTLAVPIVAVLLSICSLLTDPNPGTPCFAHLDCDPETLDVSLPPHAAFLLFNARIDADDPLTPEIAKLYKEDRKAHDDTAKVKFK